MMKTIINFRNAIIALLMIVLNSAGVKASAPWTVNPGDYRYDMTLYLKAMLIDGVMDYSDYEVGVFVGDECRGVGEVLQLGDGKHCLYLRARSNVQSGETMTFKYYDNNSGEIWSFDNNSFEFVANSRLGYPSEPYIVNLFYSVTVMADNGGSVDNQGGSFSAGTVLTVTANSDNGYHFAQWSDGNTDNPRTFVVDKDYELIAEFNPNWYNLIYIVEDTIYKEYEIAFGSTITPEDEPEKEGYTFSGWEGLPDTMPAHDVTVSGSFSVNSYHLTYVVDGETYKVYEIGFGATISPEDEPEKEGYTFSGWESLPDTMPAHDVTVSGYFSVNSYTLSIYLNDELYSSEQVEYGTPLIIEQPDIPEMRFEGWLDEIPETMPAHDLDLHGVLVPESGISHPMFEEEERVTIYSMKGILLFQNIFWKEAKEKLNSGLYVIKNKVLTIRHY